MKRAFLFAALACFSVVFAAGCADTGENTKKGAVVGGLIGAGAGAIIGQQAGGHPITGAAIGGSVGALSGSLIGSGIDKKAQGTNTSGEKLSISDIVLLSKNKISDADIISKINDTGSVFRLSAEEITMLKNEGVSNAVVNAMLNTSIQR